MTEGAKAKASELIENALGFVEKTGGPRVYPIEELPKLIP